MLMQERYLYRRMRSEVEHAMEYIRNPFGLDVIAEPRVRRSLHESSRTSHFFLQTSPHFPSNQSSLAPASVF